MTKALTRAQAYLGTGHGDQWYDPEQLSAGGWDETSEAGGWGDSYPASLGWDDSYEESNTGWSDSGMSSLGPSASAVGQQDSGSWEHQEASAEQHWAANTEEAAFGAWDPLEVDSDGEKVRACLHRKLPLRGGAAEWPFDGEQLPAAAQRWVGAGG